MRGTKRTLEVLKHLGAIPDRVLIDHVEEHRFEPLGGWILGWFTLYPLSDTKCSHFARSTCWEMYGLERILVNSSADWGPSDPFTLQECVVNFRRRGHSLQEAVEIFHNNPCHFLGQIPS